MLGEYTPTFPPHASTNAAIEHSRSLLGADISSTWVSTEDIDSKLFERYSGIWVVPGSPYKSMEKTLWAIRYARENNVPCFGTCGGFQHIVIEYARNVLGFTDAQHAEYDPYSSNLFISQLGTLAVTAGIISSWGHTHSAILGAVLSVADSGGAPVFLVVIWRDKSFWGEQSA